MAKRGRIEARVTVATGGFAVSATDSGGPTTVTVAAGNYSGPTAYAAALEAALNAAMADNWTVTISNGESGTGKVTIDCDAATFSLSWTNTSGRDLLGFTSNITASAVAVTGANQAKGIWLPDVEKWSPRGDEKSGGSNIAVTVTTTRQLQSESGHMQTLGGGSWKEIRGLRWEGVSQARTLIRYEATANESFEQFWMDTYAGNVSYFQRGSQWTIYWDADLSITTACVPVGLNEFDPQTLVPNWVGRFVVTIPLLVVVPS